ncbi:MAG: beta galactosidase jelly roll domain-containing protein, partial [Bacteroidetes bacterium]|nr:beta galactosidase jelly roll domain-containing protein [Bacteroidota bacterium]
MKYHIIITTTFFFVLLALTATSQTRKTEDFDIGWKFYLGDAPGAQEINFADAKWRDLTLPHDWSIEGKFDEHSPVTTSGGALTGGTGWYRKTFLVPASSQGKKIFIDFDGVYMNSEVWINGKYLGKRPYGYSSFRYELTPYLKYGAEKNIIAVKVNNAPQPNSRWYSGSGIYRNVWLITTEKTFVDHWGTYITVNHIDEKSATAHLEIKIKNFSGFQTSLSVLTIIYDASGKEVARKLNTEPSLRDTFALSQQDITIPNPVLWSIEKPVLYKAVTRISSNGKNYDEYETTFGIRYFNFDADNGFSLNGKHVKINGVCDHHDLGCLGTAIN